MKIYIKKVNKRKSKQEKLKGNTTWKKPFIWTVIKNKNPNAISKIIVIFSFITLQNYLLIMSLTEIKELSFPVMSHFLKAMRLLETNLYTCIWAHTLNSELLNHKLFTALMSCLIQSNDIQFQRCRRKHKTKYRTSLFWQMPKHLQKSSFAGALNYIAVRSNILVYIIYIFVIKILSYHVII